MSIVAGLLMGYFYRFVAASSAPIHVQEAWFGGRPAGYRHAVLFVFAGEVVGDAGPTSTDHPDEIAQVAWLDPKKLPPTTVHPLHRPALRKAGLL